MTFWPAARFRVETTVRVCPMRGGVSEDQFLCEEDSLFLYSIKNQLGASAARRANSIRTAVAMTSSQIRKAGQFAEALAPAGGIGAGGFADFAYVQVPATVDGDTVRCDER